MPVYLFTFHAYRSWSPGNPRGYVRKDEGIQPSDPAMAEQYDRAAKHPPVRFRDREQQAILDAVQAYAEAETQTLHYACITATHAHALLSWEGFIDWNDVRVKLKRKMGQALSKAMDKPGPWFGAGRDSRRRVNDREHFEHLMQRYLPKPDHRGLHFSERRGEWRQ